MLGARREIWLNAESNFVRFSSHTTSIICCYTRTFDSKYVINVSDCVNACSMLQMKKGNKNIRKRPVISNWS